MSPKDGNRDLAWFGAGMGVVVAAAGRWLLREGRKQERAATQADDERPVVRGELVAAAPPEPEPVEPEPVEPEPEPVEPEPEETDERFVETSLRLTPVVDLPPEWVTEVVETTPAQAPLAEHLPPAAAPPLFADEHHGDLASTEYPAFDAEDEDTSVRLPPVPPADPAPAEPSPVQPSPAAPALAEPVAPAATVAPVATGTRAPVPEVVAGVAVAGLGIAAVAGVSWAVPAVALVAVVAIGLWVVVHHPMLIFVAMAFMLGFAPGVQTPVVGISITFVLSVGIWVAMALMPEARHRAGWPAVASGLLIAVSFFAFVGNPITTASFSDFLRWTFATAAVYPLLVLPPARLAQVGRAFVYGCVLAALVGIGFVVLDPSGDRLFSLSIFGYGPDTMNSRYVLGANGAISRLTGTYVDPNLGGLILAFGLVLALALLRGRWRVLASGALVLAIALTLSRADAGSVAVAGVLLVLFGRIGGTVRARLIGLGVVAVAGLLAVPAVRERLANSFGDRDRGSSARWEAIEAMPDQLSGHWFFGRGFGAPELVDQAATAATNYVANAPLLAVYRGGVIVGIVFTGVLLVAAGAAWRLLRTASFERASLGAGYLGLMLVAFQLDIPVVTLTPAILCLALLLAFLGAAEAVDDAPGRDPETAESEAPLEPSLSRA